MKRIATSVIAAVLLIAIAVSALPAMAESDVMYVCRYRVHVFEHKTVNSNFLKMLDYGQKVHIEKKSGDWYAILVEDKKKGGQKLGWIQGKSLSKTKPGGKKKATKKPTAKPTPKPTPKPTKKPTPKPTKKPLPPAPTPTPNRRAVDRVLLSMEPVQMWTAVIHTRTPNGTVALRQEPSVQAPLIYHLENGHQLIVLAEGDGWYQVRDDEGQRIGYMASQFLQPLYDDDPFAFAPAG